MEIHVLKMEIQNLHRQMKADFEFNAAGFADLSQRFCEMSQRLAQMEGRTRLQELRFERVLVAVDNVLDAAHPDGVYQDLLRRVELIEAKISAA